MSGSLELVAWKDFNVSDPFVNDTVYYQAIVNSPHFDSSTWYFDFEIEFERYEGDGTWRYDPIFIMGSVVNQSFTIHYEPQPLPEATTPALASWILSLFGSDTAPDQSSYDDYPYAQIISGTEFDIDKHEVYIRFAVAHNETQGPYDTNILRYRLTWYNEKNGEVYLVDPYNPGVVNESFSFYDIPYEMMEYRIEGRNLFGIDQRLIIDLFYTNYIVGWLGPFAAPFRLLITPIILGGLLISPIEKLVEASEV